MEFYIEKFLKYKKLSGLMSKAICEKSGVSRSALWQWEKGITVPSDTHVYKLAECLNVKVDKISDLKPLYPAENAGIAGGIMELVDLTTNATLINNLENHLSKFIQYKDIIQNQNILMNTVINSIDIPLYIKDTNQKYIFINKPFKKALNLKDDYVIYGKTDEDFFNSKEAKRNSEIDGEVLRTGEPVKGYRNYYVGSNKKKPARTSKYPIYNHDDVIIGVLGFQIDTTHELKNEEKAEIIYYLIGAINDGLHIRELKTGKLIYISKSFEKILGYPLQEIFIKQKTDKSFFINQFIHPEDREKECLYFVNNSYPGKSRFRIIRQDGEVRWLERNVAIKKYNGKECFISICRDITEEVLREEKSMKHLLSQFELLNHFADNIGIALFICEYTDSTLKNVKYVYRNKKSYKYADETKDWKDVIAPGKRAETIKMIENADYPCLMKYDIVDMKGKLISIQDKTWISLLNGKTYFFSLISEIDILNEIEISYNNVDI